MTLFAGKQFARIGRGIVSCPKVMKELKVWVWYMKGLHTRCRKLNPGCVASIRPEMAHLSVKEIIFVERKSILVVSSS